MIIPPAVTSLPPIHLLTGTPGAGKSRAMLAKIASVPGCHILAVETLQNQDEKCAELEAAAVTAGTVLDIEIVRGAKGLSVVRSISDVARAHAQSAHSVIIITHAALMLLDLSAFPGWRLHIDEAINAVSASTLTIPATWRYYNEAYDLEPSGQEGWSRVVAKSDSPTLAEVRIDDHVRESAAFHRRVLRGNGHVLVDLAKWEDAGVPGRVVQWWSHWSLAELAGFSSVTMTGASLEKSLVMRAAAATGLKLDIRVTDLSLPRTVQPSIRIHHYTRGHTGSSHYWTTAEGRAVLLKIAADLRNRRPAFWSGNEVVTSMLEDRFGGEMTSPKLAGRNDRRNQTSCAYMYSAKALPSDRVLTNVLGISAADVLAMREDEDVWQYTMRGAPRMSDFGGTYDVYLYDERQARVLAERFRENGFEDVEIILLDGAGVAEVTRPKGGRPPKITTMTAEERADARREAKRISAQRSRHRKASKKALSDGGPDGLRDEFQKRSPNRVLFRKPCSDGAPA